MAIKVSQAFERTSAAPIDSSIALTKAQMLAVNDNLMPAYYFTICQDDGKIYLYDKTATPSATTGKFTEFSGGGGGSSDVKFFTTTDTLNKEINGTKVVAAADLPGVTWSDLVVGSSVIKDAEGTMGLVTTITGTTSVTVTTATTSTPTKELTQAEYDVLTEAEKKNGTIYFITDNYVGSTYVGAYDTIYSTTERVVGSWMGKPLYQKTVNTGIFPDNASKNVAHGISNIDKVVSIEGYVLNTSDITFSPVRLLNDFYPDVNTLVSVDATNIRISCRKNNNGSSGWTESYVTLQYTKTTDTTSPVEYASPNDYSTSEKIVGTWIDGKPLYQKTLELTNVVYDWGTMNNYGVDNIENIIDTTGVRVFFDNGNTNFWMSPFSRGDTDYLTFLFDDVGFRAIWSSTSERQYLRKMRLTLKYTKTTD